MKVNIKSEQVLNYETKGACAFDFKASEDIDILPTQAGLVETGTVIEVPEGYMLMLAPRSSTYRKLWSGQWWLILVNSVWIIDNDYHWNNDTVKFQYLNTSDEVAHIKVWDRIGQWVFVKIEKAEFNYSDHMSDTDRWGFGTTWV